MNPIAIRLLSQQLAAPQYDTPVEVVNHFGAMQAQEYKLMRWAVSMRTKHPSEKAFTQAYNDGEIIRMHLLRGTWQLISGEDYWWMLHLCGAKAKSVIKGWMSSNKISLSEKEIMHIREIMVEVATLKRSITKEDIAEALKERNIVMDDHRLSYHIRMAELDGVLCSGDLLPQKATYSLSSSKIKNNTQKDYEEGVMLLARKYFQSHQPATLEDFVWWSGLNISDCRKAIELLRDEIHVVKYQDCQFYLLNNCRTRGYRGGKYILLPSYDEYLIGYKSRKIVLDPTFKSKAHNNSGIFQPVIAFNGNICGNWKPSRCNLEASFFKGEHETENLKSAWVKYNNYKLKK